MDCDVRKQPNGTQLSFRLPQQAYSPNVYPITTADGSTIVVYGHERGVNTLKLRSGTKGNDLTQRLQELDEDESTHTKLEQWINVNTDSPAVRIAIPHLQSSAIQTPNFFRTHVAVVVACADSLLRLITFPFTLDARGKHDEIKTTILNTTYHQDLVTSLALSWSVDANKPGRNDLKSQKDEDQLQFLIASASVTGGGLLAYHEVSLRGHLAGDDNNDQLLAKEFVEAPLLGSTLAFSHDARRLTQYPLLLATSPAHGLIHILALDDMISSGKRRRGEDVSVATGETSPGLSLRIVLSLYAPYQATHVPVRRKSVLDAKWVVRATGITALFEDGEWGVCHIDSLDTRSNGRSSKARLNASNSFSILGNMSSTTRLQKSTGRPVTDTIAAVTPHTHKARSAALFQNVKLPPNTTLSSSQPIGQITVCEDSSATPSSEALILSYNGDNLYVPTLKPYLQTDQPGGITAVKSSERRFQSLPPIRFGGERQLCIRTRGAPSQRKSVDLLGTMNTRPDLLVVTDSRLILHNNNVNLKSLSESSGLSLPLRSIGSKETSFMSRVTNEDTLDVDAMDQILESMENNESSNRRLPSSTQNGNAIQADEQLLSLSSHPSSASKLMIEGRQSTARRKLFG